MRPTVARAATSRGARLCTSGILAQTSGDTLGTAAKQMVILARPSLARGANVILTVGVVVAYFFAARLSLALLEPADGVAVFWPAGGVASGILPRKVSLS